MVFDGGLGNPEAFAASLFGFPTRVLALVNCLFGLMTVPGHFGNCRKAGFTPDGGVVEQPAPAADEPTARLG